MSICICNLQNNSNLVTILILVNNNNIYIVTYCNDIQYKNI